MLFGDEVEILKNENEILTEDFFENEELIEQFAVGNDTKPKNESYAKPKMKEPNVDKIGDTIQHKFFEDEELIEQFVAGFDSIPENESCTEDEMEQEIGDIIQHEFFEDEELFEQFVAGFDSIPEDEKEQEIGDTIQHEFFEDEELIEQFVSEFDPIPIEEELIDKMFNKLVYQGQEYYVKRKNEGFPISVMNNKLVIVGMIREDDMNNIIMN